MNTVQQTKLTLAARGWRARIALAFALMTILPLLTLTFLFWLRRESSSASGEMILFAIGLNLVLSLTGFGVMLGILISLSRFHAHLGDIARGSSPETPRPAAAPEKMDSLTNSVSKIVEQVRHQKERFRILSEELEQKVEQQASELKQVRMSLHNSRERFSKAVHASPAPVLIVRLGSERVIDANERFMEATGLAASNVIGNTLFKLSIGANAEEDDRLLQILQEQNRVKGMPFRLRCHSGETMDMLITLETITIGNNPSALVIFTNNGIRAVGSAG